GGPGAGGAFRKSSPLTTARIFRSGSYSIKGINPTRTWPSPGKVLLRLEQQMRRRDFITLIGGAAAWPLAALAQQAGKLPTVGFLGQNTRSAGSEWTAAFVQRVVSGTPAVMASKRATSTIPIVFATAGDPVGNHLVDSLARPGGNVTGLSVQSNELAG